MKTLVVALGGNALLQRGEALTAKNQYRNIASAVPRWRACLSAGDLFGNGPQVGLLALQERREEVEPYPLDVLVAEGGDGQPVLAQSLSAQPAACHDGADAH